MDGNEEEEIDEMIEDFDNSEPYIFLYDKFEEVK